MALSVDILELARHLKEERLYVSTERENLQKLNEDVKKVAEEMYHASWVAKQQRSILESLIRSSQDATPADCCGRINQLHTVNFVDSYKYLSYHDTKYGEFLKLLRESPKLLGRCIAACEKETYEVAQCLVECSMSSIYGNCVMQEDEMFVLQLLKILLDVQVAPNTEPRRLIRKGRCSFSRVFKQFFDNLFSAKLFLTAALHEPVMRLLMEDEWFYDIDPDKAVIRFPPSERLKRFGEPGTDEYKTKLANYRKFIVDKLVSLSMRFIQSIKNNLHCFPSSLIWIVSQLFLTLTKSERVELAEMRSTCADLVFGLFICPAICDPEPFGITSDVPISHIARHNLMQIAQIIQVLAISRWEDIDQKVRDLYGRFDKGCMSNVLDAMLDGSRMEMPGNVQSQPYSRAAVLITPSQLSRLVAYLRSAVPLLEEGSPEKKLSDELLSPLPANLPLTLNSQTSTSSQTPPGTPISQKKALRALKKRPSHLSSEEAQNNSSEDNPDAESNTSSLKQPEDVIVISLGQSFDCPGMLSEQKVLSLENEKRRRRVKYQDVLSYDINSQGPEIQEKRTRFSLSHDQESIGNTSDIQEAISEAASSHSVGSVDLENDNDNFSDMLSANVSGRGTPNISGRDTPLSQAESVEERRAPDLPETVQKTNREDVTDRFGKFDIRPEFERDEAKSTVSETWSTDVLASDSEPPESNQMERLEEVTEEIVRHNFLPEPAGEVSETASESAWSTDVLASDTDDKQSELLTDLEQDDVSSVGERSRPGDDDRDLDVLDDNPGEDNKEDTPQASGGQSPSEDRLLDSLGAVGGGTLYRNNRATGRVCRSDPAILIKRTSEEDEFTVEHRPKRSVSAIVQNFQKSERYTFSASKRQSDSLKAAEGKVTTLRAALEGDSAESFEEDIGLCKNQYTYQGARPKIQIIGESVDEFISSPDLGYESPESDRAANGNFDLGEFVQTNSRASDPPVEDYFAVTSPSADVLASDSVKLSEQQNTKIDAKRLSTSLVMFDPLVPSDEEGDLVDVSIDGSVNHSSLETDHSPYETSQTHNSSNRSSQASMKSVVLADISSSTAAERQGILVPTRNSQAELSGCQDLITVNQTEGEGRRRDSSGSSQSTHSANITDLSGSSPKAETISQKSDEKEVIDYEDKNDYGKRKKGSLFNKFKERIGKGKGMKKKGSKIDRDDVETVLSQSIGENDGKVYIPGRDEPDIIITETTDDILDKYRKKVPSQSSSPSQYDGLEAASQNKDKGQMTKDDDIDAPPFYDPNNLEGCYAFQDAKRKLRLVLSTGDFQMGVCIADLLFPGSGQLSPREHDLPRHDNDLVKLLRMQLAEAINLQNKDLIAQLHEAIRCVRLFDTQGCKKLLKALQEEYRVRSSYVAYLVRCRQGLLMSLSHLQKLHSRIERDNQVCSKHFTNVCVRLFIESKEKAVLKFMSDFQKLTVSDEKTDLVDRFLRSLYDYMERDSMWDAANETQLEDARLSLERFIMSRIYTHAIFPNGDGDVMRDQILNKHIRHLSQIITPNHRDVRIPRMYHHECPWPAAHREIFMINAYKTPKDKLQCVIRCAKTIMNLLRLANEKSIPAADDFMPVFIYVLIKANPPGLLSTIQYVNSFYENRLEGEEQYWWMQLCSAVEFIKTMD